MVCPLAPIAETFSYRNRSPNYSAMANWYIRSRIPTFVSAFPAWSVGGAFVRTRLLATPRASVPKTGPDPKKGHGSKILGSHISVRFDGVAPLQGESPTNIRTPRCLPSLYTRLAMKTMHKK